MNHLHLILQISHNDSTVISGFVSELTPSDCVTREVEELNDLDKVTLSSEDIYTILRLKGYSYK